MPTRPLYTSKHVAKRWFNRVFAYIYAQAISALIYRHCLTIIHHSPASLISFSLFLADLVLVFMWATFQCFHLNPISSEVFPENLSQILGDGKDYPGLDVFICTADPYKEPPIGVVNTALSVMAYEYATEKLSVYVSDDGGSQLTLFAFMEAAEFAKHWLPYCRKYDIMDRSPEVYFRNDHTWFPETDEIKAMYENMKARVENVVNKGAVDLDKIIDDRWIKSFSKWTPGFTPHHHPTVIEVLLESTKDKDIASHPMPNLIYVSREKSKVAPHHFKAGALNVLIRVSGVMTNAPILVVLDCDMYSNDPKTPLRTLCHFMDPNADSNLAFVQFPQRFHNINKYDTYGGEFKFENQINPLGMDGLGGTWFMGTGGFFRRQAFYGSPSSINPSDFKQVKTRPMHKPIQSEEVLALAHDVASSSYELNTKWGNEMGFKYGCLVEDVYTGFRLQCQGWKSVFCKPTRDAFLGNTPIALNDILYQFKRWYMGFLQMGFYKYSPITFGIRSMNPLLALCYTHYTFRWLWAIPVIIYAFLPQLALVNSFSIFPKVSDTWFLLYVFLFLGAYGKDFLDFMLAGGDVQRWWNYQRMWLIWGCSSHPFALFDYALNSLGISTSGFNVTSKVVDDELNKRYEKGMLEFGVASPLILSISIVATVNLFTLIMGLIEVSMQGRFEEFFMQLFIAGFGVVNSWPIYEAMVLRRDNGRMPLKITLTSISIAMVVYATSSLAF